MKPYACLAAFAGAALILASPGVSALPSPFVGGLSSTYFGTDAAPADLAVELVHAARKRVLVAGYAAISPALAAALRDAGRRGVEVGVVLDRSGPALRYSGAAFLAGSGIEVVFANRAGLTRQPFVVADDAVALGVPRATEPGTATAATAKTATAMRSEPALRGLSVFRDVPQLAQAYTRSFWRLYRLAGGR